MDISMVSADEIYLRESLPQCDTVKYDGDHRMSIYCEQTEFSYSLFWAKFTHMVDLLNLN